MTETSGHLPECPMEVHKGEDLWDDPLFGFPCWCYALRAREQRVRMEDDDYAYVAAQAEADGRRRGWVEALDAAREALLSAWFTANRDEMTWPDALAAIDALWEAPYGRNR